jgi:hypothetical protein
LAQTTEQTSAFNRAATGFGDWLYQRRHGRHDQRHAEMIGRLETFPGGKELLQLAQDVGCDIRVTRKGDVGAEGSYDNSGEKPVIRISNTGNPAGMALALWHELRHMQQDAANPGTGFASGGQLKDPRTAYLMGVMIEADAFTAETLLAVQQKKAGHPEYYDAMFGRRLETGSHREIYRFLQQNPNEGFRDDAAFSRALFTHLMTEGLVSYRAQYMARISYHFATSDNADAFREKVAGAKRGGTKSTPALNALYGPQYMSVSPRALATAFLPAQSTEERMILDIAQRAVEKAPTLTETEFQTAKREVTLLTKDYWYKDPDEPQYLAPAEMKAREELRQAALSDKPSTRPLRPKV